MLEMSQIINEITLENYRCFHERQVAPLAPLTLLVGENSTGKTSLLAMIRVLWDCIHGHRVPNFKEEPFDLGSFREVVNNQENQSGTVPWFEAQIRIYETCEGEFVFGKKGTVPVPIKMRFTDRENWIEQSYDNEGNPNICLGTSRGEWKAPRKNNGQGTAPLSTLRHLLPVITPDIYYPDYSAPLGKFVPLNASPSFSREDNDSIKKSRLAEIRHSQERPFAFAPVRCSPRRTYDPAALDSDPQGYYIPMLLSDLARKDDHVWKTLKNEIEIFGSSTGLFDEIHVNHLGKSEGDPFQIQIGKSGNRQNLTDVGYGISQVLPILTELLLPENSRMVLLQQPEGNLHPRIQAALGTLLCETAARGRQLVLEPHGEHLINRIRIDVRDGTTGLNPEDVSILFFERKNLSAQIHPIQIDELGNILNAPDSYRRFFMEETKKSLGI